MRRGGTRAVLVAALALAAGAFAVLATTGPSPSEEASGVIRRQGGPCLRLERWGLIGWTTVGITQTISDTQNAGWIDEPPSPDCQEAPVQTYLVRLPRGGPDGVYRLCGIADGQPCIEFRRVPFDPGEPGP